VTHAAIPARKMSHFLFLVHPKSARSTDPTAKNASVVSLRISPEYLIRWGWTASRKAAISPTRDPIISRVRRYIGNRRSEPKMTETSRPDRTQSPTPRFTRWMKKG
jgi:hypothetical protein